MNATESRRNVVNRARWNHEQLRRLGWPYELGVIAQNLAPRVACSERHVSNGNCQQNSQQLAVEEEQ
jgi:hypothetical protein